MMCFVRNRLGEVLANEARKRCVRLLVTPEVASGWIDACRETNQCDDAYRHCDECGDEHFEPRLTLFYTAIFLGDTIDANWGKRV
jgi:hypothetical protein